MEIQQYGPWLSGELERYSRRSHKSDMHRTPSHPLGVVHKGPVALPPVPRAKPQDLPKKDSLKIKQPFNGDVKELNFAEKLREIDNDLGLDIGDCREITEGVNMEDCFQNLKAGKSLLEGNLNIVIGLNIQGLSASGPNLGKQKRPNSGSWKRLIRSPLGPPIQDPHLQQLKRAHQDFIDEELEQNLKKKKPLSENNGSSDMEISAMVAKQPRRKI